jgi:hypothetical protein
MVHTIFRYTARFGLAIVSKRGKRHDFAETTIKWLENQSSQGCMAEVILRLDAALRQVNSFVESYKRMHEMEYNIVRFRYLVNNSQDLLDRRMLRRVQLVSL